MKGGRRGLLGSSRREEGRKGRDIPEVDSSETRCLLGGRRNSGSPHCAERLGRWWLMTPVQRMLLQADREFILGPVYLKGPLQHPDVKTDGHLAIQV